MVLSDRDIKKALESGRIGITSIEDLETQLQPCSVDLRLGTQITQFRPPYYCSGFGQAYTKPRVIQVGVDDPSEQMWTNYLGLGVRVPLGPGEFALATTVETITLPPDILGRVDGRSSVARLGICCHITAGFIDPGFSGQITLEMYNFSDAVIELELGMRICQISFEQLSSPCDRPYGPARGSKYQNQVGATPSRLRRDST